MIRERRARGGGNATPGAAFARVQCTGVQRLAPQLNEILRLLELAGQYFDLLGVFQ